MAKAKKRIIAVFHFQKVRAIGAFIFKAKGMLKSMTDNATLFSSPPIAFSTVSNNIDALEQAQIVVETRVLGAAAERDIHFNLVCSNINELINYVQQLADQANTTASAQNIVQLAGLSVKSVGGKQRQTLKVSRNSDNKTIILLAKSYGTRAAYHWQVSPDGGATWNDLGLTTKAKFIVKGLKWNAPYLFRFKAVDAKGETKWSDGVKG